MIALGFALFNLLLGLHALVRGKFQLNHYLLLRGMSARIAGLFLMVPLSVGLFLAGLTAADWQGATQSVMGCSYMSIIGVFVFAALQAGVARRSRKERLLESKDGTTKARTHVVSRNGTSINAQRFTRL